VHECVDDAIFNVKLWGYETWYSRFMPWNSRHPLRTPILLLVKTYTMSSFDKLFTKPADRVIYTQILTDLVNAHEERLSKEKRVL